MSWKINEMIKYVEFLRRKIAYPIRKCYKFVNDSYCRINYCRFDKKPS